jgi:SAM-dependent methyltransferase
VRLLDPCAGTGEAAAEIAAALGAESFGIELNEERAAACRARLGHVLATSAFSVRLANGAFSCLWLNPPYDYDDEQRRAEHAFLTTMTRALAPGGLLVFLIPQRRLVTSARYLASHYGGCRAYRFPDPEFGAFGQMVLFATKKRQAVLDPAARATLEQWGEVELPPLPDEPGALDADSPLHGLRVPALPAGEILFSSLFFDPAQAAAEARRRGAWSQPQLTEQLWPGDERPVRPLMPLRRGHLALLTAAGFLNNLALEQDGRRVLVKGSTRKVFVRVDTDDEDTIVERETIRTAVVVLDLDSGALQLVDHGEDQDGGEGADGDPGNGDDGKTDAEPAGGGAAADGTDFGPAASAAQQGASRSRGDEAGGMERLPALPRGPSLSAFL